MTMPLIPAKPGVSARPTICEAASPHDVQAPPDRGQVQELARLCRGRPAAAREFGLSSFLHEPGLDMNDIHFAIESERGQACCQCHRAQRTFRPIDRHQPAVVAADGAHAGLGTVLSASYFLWYYQQAFLGSARAATPRGLLDLGQRELWIAATLGVLVIAMGMYTTPFLSTMNGSLKEIEARLLKGSVPAAAAPLTPAAAKK